MFNKKKNEDQQEDVLSLEEIKSQNEDMYGQLTNKNQDYMFQLNSRLESLEYDPVKKEYVFHEMLEEIITAQEQHITARKTYGTVTEQADNILGKNVRIQEEAEERSETWKIYVDGALLAGGMFNLISGFGALQSPDALETQVSLWQVIINFLLGGLAIMMLTRYAPRKGETKGLLKYGIATVVIVISWAILTSLLLAIIPNAINPIIPGAVVMVIGALALVGKWQFKKRLDVKGTLF